MSDKKIESYLQRFKKYKGGIQSLKWNSYKSAAIRFSNLVENVELKNKNILDIGSGLGDLIPFISSKTLDFTYTGIDLLQEFVDESQKRYPDFRFVIGDYFKNPLKEKFDIIFCSGVLNGKPEKIDVIEERKVKIKQMFNHVNDVLAFNMAGGAQPKNFEESVVHYANSLEILEYCLTLTSKIIFKQNYHEKDFTIMMFK